MQKEARKEDIGFTEIVRRHFDNDEDISLSCKVFVHTLTMFMMNEAHPMCDHVATALGEGFLREQFIRLIEIDPDVTDSLIDDIFDLSFKFIDFKALFRDYYLDDMVSVVDGWLELDREELRSRVRFLFKRDAAFAHQVFDKCMERYAAQHLSKLYDLESTVDFVIEDMDS